MRPVGDRLLPAAFFGRQAEVVARELLGKLLVSTVGNSSCGGVIVEVEAYLGANDPGSHAATRGITARNRVMYGAPGHAYVYFTYGNHHMLNVVAESEGTAAAVLIRAIEPVLGVAVMEERRGRRGVELTNGPGKTAQALGIDLSLNGERLGDRLRVYDAPGLKPDTVGTSGRIGLSAGHDAPLRFYVKGNAYVSRGKTGPRPKKRVKGAPGEE